MICPHCGSPNETGATECRDCQAPLAQDPNLAPRFAQTSGKAIWALVLGILGITCFWIFTGIPAIILGFSAKRDIRQRPEYLSGSGLATAGIVTGFLSILFSVIPLMVVMTAAISIPNFMEAQERAKVARSKSELRNLGVALETYYIDNRAYPPTLYALTTPVVHQNRIPFDPFAPEGSEAIFDYATDYDRLWVTRSIGPDQDVDVDLHSLVGRAHDASHLKALYQPLEYDPTNGTISSGDVLRAGP